MFKSDDYESLSLDSHFVNKFKWLHKEGHIDASSPVASVDMESIPGVPPTPPGEPYSTPKGYYWVPAAVPLPLNEMVLKNVKHVPSKSSSFETVRQVIHGPKDPCGPKHRVLVKTPTFAYSKDFSEESPRDVGERNEMNPRLSTLTATSSWTDDLARWSLSTRGEECHRKRVLNKLRHFCKTYLRKRSLTSWIYEMDRATSQGDVKMMTSLLKVEDEKWAYLCRLRDEHIPCPRREMGSPRPTKESNAEVLNVDKATGIAKKYVRINALVNLRFPVYYTNFLHSAVHGGSYEAVRLLLDQGGDVNARSADLKTPLHISCAIGDSSYDMSYLMYQHALMTVKPGATPWIVSAAAKTSEGLTILDAAIFSTEKTERTIQWLRDVGASTAKFSTEHIEDDEVFFQRVNEFRSTLLSRSRKRSVRMTLVDIEALYREMYTISASSTTDEDADGDAALDIARQNTNVRNGSIGTAATTAATIPQETPSSKNDVSSEGCAPTAPTMTPGVVEYPSHSERETKDDPGRSRRWMQDESSVRFALRLKRRGTVCITPTFGKQMNKILEDDDDDDEYDTAEELSESFDDGDDMLECPPGILNKVVSSSDEENSFEEAFGSLNELVFHGEEDDVKSYDNADENDDTDEGDAPPGSVRRLSHVFSPEDTCPDEFVVENGNEGNIVEMGGSFETALESEDDFGTVEAAKLGGSDGGGGDDDDDDDDDNNNDDDDDDHSMSGGLVAAKLPATNEDADNGGLTASADKPRATEDKVSVESDGNDPRNAAGEKLPSGGGSSGESMSDESSFESAEDAALKSDDEERKGTECAEEAYTLTRALVGKKVDTPIEVDAEPVCPNILGTTKVTEHIDSTTTLQVDSVEAIIETAKDIDSKVDLATRAGTSTASVHVENVDATATDANGLDRTPGSATELDATTGDTPSGGLPRDGRFECSMSLIGEVPPGSVQSAPPSESTRDIAKNDRPGPCDESAPLSLPLIAREAAFDAPLEETPLGV